MDLKTAILGIDDRKPQAVEVPEWALTIYLRPLSGTDRDALEAWQQESEDNVGFRAQLVALHLCEEDGTPLEMTPAEVVTLGEKSARALERLVNVCATLSGYTQEEVEKLEGNSQAALSGDSG